jgi:hypothetical protein
VDRFSVMSSSPLVSKGCGFVDGSSVRSVPMFAI